LIPSTVKLLHREKERKNQWGLGGCRLGLKPAPDEIFGSMLSGVGLFFHEM
jgi:hypothetical protein